MEVPNYEPLRNFESLEVLQSWLNVNGGVVYVIPMNGVVDFSNPDDSNDCDDQAKRLQDKAINDGYNLSLQVVDSDGFLMGKQVNKGGLPHMGNLAIIGNNIYYVDGINKQVTWISYVD